MYIKIIFGNVAVNAPDAVLQHRTGHNLPTIAQEQLQKLELAWTQLHTALAIGQAVGRTFQRIVAVTQIFRAIGKINFS